MVEPAAVRPMTVEEYEAYRQRSIDGYADQMREAGAADAGTAREESARQLAGMLPQGAETNGMRLLVVLDDEGASVGVLWLGPHPRRTGAGWVYDLEVEEARRGTGLGRRAMLAAEEIGRREGWTAIGLNVFGPNARARALYDSLGYDVVATNMLKPLRP